jgi:hypothetical protein
MAITMNVGEYNAQSKWIEATVTIAEGATLKVWQASIQTMSDVWEMTTYATYWDEAQARLQTVPWVTKATVDATPEVLEKVKGFLYSRAYEEALLRAEDEVQTIGKGAIVKVTKGRQGKGTVGKVVIDIMRPYQMGWQSVQSRKLGIATSDVTVKVAAANGKVYDNYKDVTWAWARNCQLVEVPEVDLQSVKESARAKAEGEYQRIYKAA